MKTTKAIIAVILLCSVFGGAAFAVDKPLDQIRRQQVDPDGTRGACDGVEFSKDGTYYAAGDNHSVARIYRTSNGAYLAKVTHEYSGGDCAKSEAEINAIAFSADGHYLATGDGGKGGCKVWDATLFDTGSYYETSTPLHFFRSGKEVDGLDFSLNNKWLAIASDADLYIYDQQNNFNQIKIIPKESGQGAINSVDFSSDSRYLVFTGGGDDYIYVYSTPDQSGGNNWVFQDKFRVSGHGSVKSVRFSPDDKYIGIGSRNQKCAVWRRVNNDWTNWTLEHSFSHSGENQSPLPCDDTDSNAAVEAIEWSADGQYFISGGLISGRMHLWHVDTWDEVTYNLDSGNNWIQGQEEKRQIEFIDTWGDLVIVGGDEGGIRLFEFPLVDWIELENFALLSQYWMDDCGDVDDCLAADYYVDGTIDIFDLEQLALSWLGEEVMHIYKPISYWQFNEQAGTSAADSIGDNYGTLINFPTDDSQWASGALNFDGIDDYVEITGYKGITGTQSRTVSTWINTSMDGVFVNWGTPGSDGGNWVLHLNSTVGWGGVTGALRVSVGGGQITGTTDLRDNKWHHVTAVLLDDGSPNVGEVKLYVDGELETPSYIDEQAINTASDINMLIGAYNGGTVPFTGLIDEVTIYGKALSQAEILKLYTTNQ